MKGKKLPYSLAELGAKVRAGDFGDIHKGDYIPVTLTTGEVVNMVVDSIHTQTDDDTIKSNRHIIIIPKEEMR